MTQFYVDSNIVILITFNRYRDHNYYYYYYYYLETSIYSICINKWKAQILIKKQSPLEIFWKPSRHF